MRVCYCYVLCYRHQFLVGLNVCYSIFVVYSSSPINLKFHRPPSVALLYSISGVLNDICVFKVYLFVFW